MKGWSDIKLILGRLRPFKRLTSTHVLSQCAAIHGETVQPINFFKAPMGGSPVQKCLVLFLHCPPNAGQMPGICYRQNRLYK